MERKTKLTAGDGKHDFVITREFDIPADLLFQAHTDAGIFEEWMSHEYGKVKVLKLEAKKHGGFEFQTSDVQGNVLFSANGVIHECIPGQKITRTFEMENSPFPVQLEFLEFQQLGEERSKLVMHVVFRSASDRDELLKLPFIQGLNMAHDRLQHWVETHKS